MTSKKELQASYDACDTERTYLSFALQAALDGEVEWLTQGDTKAGIVRPTSASGGAVIIRKKFDKFPRVYGLETWVSTTIEKVNRLMALPLDAGHAHDLKDERELARRVLRVRNEILDKV